jgi:TRAP-type C4-dicarboxylate transport system substrate-binding protein
VAPHITKVNFGSQFAGGLSINKDVWASFPADMKKIFLAVSAEYDVRFAKGQQAAADKLLGIMVKKGAKVAELPAAERKRWAQAIPNIAKAWAAGLEKKGLPGKAVLKGYMQGLAKAGVQVPRDWSAE